MLAICWQIGSLKAECYLGRYSCEEGWPDSLGDSLSWLLEAALIEGNLLGDELGILDIDGWLH